MQVRSTNAMRTLLLRQGGFTLLELTAVVLIITILVSLLCAALNQTKSKALRVSCVDNMKQLQIAWYLYTIDYNERLPLNQKDPAPTHPRIPVVNSSSNSWVAGNPKIDLSTANIRRGSLYPYSESIGVYRCPSDDSTVMGHYDTARTRSYAMNAFLGGDPEWKPKMTLNELINPRPESTFVFIEEHEGSVWSSSFFVSPRSKLVSAASLAWVSTPSDRHTQGCNITFADGHIEYWRWFSPKTEGINQQLTSNGRELRDIRRLQATVPTP